MITLLMGDNSFEIERALNSIADSFSGDIEKIDGSSLQLSQLPDILMGISLFATARTVVIRNLSSNVVIWPVFGEWLQKISDDIHLVLIEPKPDKRTTTFKSLKKHAVVKEFNSWNDRDLSVAEKWAIVESKKMGIELDKKNAQLLVQRVGFDQWQLFYALEKLSMSGTISTEVIKDIIDANPIENVFNLFDTALRGDIVDLKYRLNILSKTQDVYLLFALLSSQAFHLAAVAAASKSDDIAKDFGVHPFVVSKMKPIAGRIGKSGSAKIVNIFSQADDDMKISLADPWLLIERALIKVARI